MRYEGILNDDREAREFTLDELKAREKERWRLKKEKFARSHRIPFENNPYNKESEPEKWENWSDGWNWLDDQKNKSINDKEQ